MSQLTLPLLSTVLFAALPSIPTSIPPPLHSISSLSSPSPLPLCGTTPPTSASLSASFTFFRTFRKSVVCCLEEPFLEEKKNPFFEGNEKIESPDDSNGNEDNKIENFERIAGLMTNRENLILGAIKKQKFECDGNTGNGEDYGENVENDLLRIREGVKMMAKARRMSVGEDVDVEKEEGFALEEMVLCLAMTNGVQVQKSNGSTLGIAVYDATFSWINHSCSPNSCYRFLVGQENDEQKLLRIAPAARGGHTNGNGDGLVMEGGLRNQLSERNGYGPRVVVRSIKTISKGEEVTIAYTDLLQPKEMRQAELWLKYQFSCSCNRCAAVPTTYVDYALQASIVDNPKNLESSYSEVEKLMQNIDEAIADYLSSGDSTSCCQMLEHLLCHGNNETKPPQKVKLHPFNHLSICAYTTLASAYKVQATDKLAELEQHKLEAFNMYKTSCAYSLLLAGVANHLFMSEPAIVVAAANFWTNSGESLLNLARSSLWDAPFQLELSSFLTLKCNGCCPAEISEPNLVRPDERSRLYNCIASLTPKVWSFLTRYSSFLKLAQNPVDLSWLESPETLEISGAESKRRQSSTLEVKVCNDEVRKNLILLSFHCLRYGALLSSICYGLSVETNFYGSLQVIMQA